VFSTPCHIDILFIIISVQYAMSYWHRREEAHMTQLNLFILCLLQLVWREPGSPRVPRVGDLFSIGLADCSRWVLGPLPCTRGNGPGAATKHFYRLWGVKRSEAPANYKYLIVESLRSPFIKTQTPQTRGMCSAAQCSNAACVLVNMIRFIYMYIYMYIYIYFLIFACSN
jgi:hypothetical protein